MNKESKVYVAGHNGMVGSAIVRELRAQGYHNLVVRSSSELNLKEQQSVNEFFEKERPDYVFIAAAKVGGIMANNVFRADFLYDNLAIQNNVIHSAYKTNVKRLQFLGSSCIYPKLAPQPLKEEYLLTGELEPTNEPYAIAKICGIKLCDAFRAQYGCDFHSVMPTNLYGPNDNYNLNSSHVLPALIRKFYLAKLWEDGDVEHIKADLAKNSEHEDDWEQFLNDKGIVKEQGQVTVHLWGSGKPLREFLHVDDLAKACVFLMTSGYAGSFLNVGVGEDISIKDLAHLIKRKLGFGGRVSWDQSKPDGTPRKLMSVDKIKALGWAPTITLEKGISSVIENYLAE